MTPKQMSLSMQHDAGYERHRKATRRDVFLAKMDQVVPWAQLCAVIAPHYPKDPEPGEGGRRAIGLERMLRIHFLQQWYALSYPAVEEALCDSSAMRRFVGIDLGQEGVPDETTVCKFRHLLEKHDLADPLFDAVSEYLKRHGMKLSQGTIVDATIIAAAPSTKNRAEARDPQMHQTKKGRQWYFGMKAHIGVDEGSGLVHTVVSTAANVADVTEVANLLHRKEQHVFGNAGYIGAQKRAAKRGGRTFWIAAKRRVVKAIDDPKLREITEQREHAKASIRAAVEQVLKRQFGYVKARYKGLAKNGAQVTTLFALVNLWMARKRLLHAA